MARRIVEDTRGMEGFNKRFNWVNGKFVCRLGGADGVLKVSRSEQNPGRIYGKFPSIGCGKFLGWLDECEDSPSGKDKGMKAGLSVEPSMPGDDSAELLELKDKVAGAMMMVYMCKKDVNELIMCNNNPTKELATLRMQVAALVIEIGESRKDVAELMEKMFVLVEKATELKEVWDKVLWTMMMCGMGIGTLVAIVMFLVVIIISVFK